MPFIKGQSGNPKGQPRKPEVAFVREAIEAVGKEKKKTLWKHLIEQCYEDNAVLVAVAKKFVPDKIQAEISDVSDPEQERKALDAVKSFLSELKKI